MVDPPYFRYYRQFYTVPTNTMALWSVAFLGSTLIGAPITGVVTEQFGGRAGLLLGAIACLVAAAFGAISLRRSPPAKTPAVSVRPVL